MTGWSGPSGGRGDAGKRGPCILRAYRDEKFEELLRHAGHIVFNSPRKLEKFDLSEKKAGKSVGPRVDPECSAQEDAIYDPCAPGSRLGVTRAQ